MSETPSTPPGVAAVPALVPPGPAGYPPPPFVPRQNGMAVASLVLGILSLTGMSWLTGIPGVILGHLALRQIRASRGAETGESLAMGGLVTGYIGIGLVVLGILIGLVFLLFMVGLVGLAGLSAAAA